MPSLFVLTPFFLLVVVNLPFKFLRTQIAFWLAGALLFAQVLLSIFYPLNIGRSYPDPFERFFTFGLSIDSLASIMLFTIGIVAFVSLLVAASTITEERRRFHFINLLLISLIGMNTTVLVTDLFTLYVFVEITALAAFVLIALEKGRLAIEGTFKYLILSAVASVFMLVSIAFFLLAAGSTSFGAIKEAFLDVSPNNFLLKIGTGLFLCGLLIKCGVVPFHGWVPDAYSAAPASVSVLLAGVVTKVSGVYVLLRLFGSLFVLSASLQNTLLFVGAFSIVFAALASLTQVDFKRMLAYSSISQVGYIVLALGAATPLAFVGAVFHFFNHAVFKSLLFVNAASLEKRLGTTDMRKMAGLGSKMQVTSATSLVGLLSTAGIPPLSGFWSKLIIIIALFSSGRYVYAAVALLASVITLAYFLSLERMVFFGRVEAAPAGVAKAPFGITFSEILLTTITIAAGLGFVFILNMWLLPLKEIVH
jgi:proton-translocating NADH-quinone oxidoreductase chain N